MLQNDDAIRLASTVLLSALAIPIITTAKTRGGYFDMDENKSRSARLTSLLRVSRTPTRETLLKEAVSKKIIMWFSFIRIQFSESSSFLNSILNSIYLCITISTPFVMEISYLVMYYLESALKFVNSTIFWKNSSILCLFVRKSNLLCKVYNKMKSYPNM